MNSEKAWYEDVVMPALLRHAWSAYGREMRQALEDAGYDDIPKNGLYVIGGLAMENMSIPLAQLIQELGVSKQAASQLVDILVLRGYLAREVDGEDRRRMTVELTERGRAAAAAQAAARKALDAELLARVGAEDMLRTRRTLAALFEIAHSRSAGRSDETGERHE